MNMKKFGFTLGEILIALAVIGVVAGLVLPQLVTGQKAAQARAQFNTAYSLLAKSIADMDADNVSVDPASYGAPQALYKILKEYQLTGLPLPFRKEHTLKIQHHPAYPLPISGKSFLTE